MSRLVLVVTLVLTVCGGTVSAQPPPSCEDVRQAQAEYIGILSGDRTTAQATVAELRVENTKLKAQTAQWVEIKKALCAKIVDDSACKDVNEKPK